MSSSDNWSDDDDENDANIASVSTNYIKPRLFMSRLQGSARRDPLPVLAGRRNIREIKRLHQLAIETKTAHYEEISRKMRIADYEKELDQIFPNGEAKNRMILDFNPVTKEPCVIVDPHLVQHLKDHQVSWSV